MNKWLLIPILIVITIILGAGCLMHNDELIEDPTILTKLHGKILYATYSIEGDYYIYKDIYMLDLDADLLNGKRLIEVNTSIDAPPAFVPSPDRKKLAFFNDEGLWVLNIDTRNMKRIIEGNQGSDHYIAWHPNGQSLAYVDGRDLYLVNIDGTGQNRIVENRFGIYQRVGRVEDQIRRPIWLVNGSIILFDDFPAPPFITRRTGEIRQNPTAYVFDVEKSIVNPLRIYNEDDFKLPYSFYLSLILPSSNLTLYDEIYLCSADHSEYFIIAKFNLDKNKWIFNNEYYDYIFDSTFLLSSDKDIFLSLDRSKYLYRCRLELYDHGKVKKLDIRRFIGEVLTGAWSSNNHYVALSGESNKILILEPNTKHIAILPIEQEDYVEVIAWIR